MKEIKGDITEVAYGYVCHQVNCQGAMGAGVALAIKNKWPITYTKYRQAYKEGKLVLGNTIWVPANPQITVIHMCGQNRYGKGIRHTNYLAFEETLKTIQKKASPGVPIYFPDHIGCALAGGDWGIIKRLIREQVPDAIITKYTQGR